VPPEARGNVKAMTGAWLDWSRQEEANRAEALRIAPSYARIKAGIARRLPVEGADLEADPTDLY
jgi:hypothetical protein